MTIDGANVIGLDKYNTTLHCLSNTKVLLRECPFEATDVMRGGREF